MSLVPLLVRYLKTAARRAAADPRNRQKAQEIFDKEVKPKAEEAWKQAKPSVDSALGKAKDRFKKSALPVSDLKGFSSRIRDEFEKGLKGE